MLLEKTQQFLVLLANKKLLYNMKNIKLDRNNLATCCICFAYSFFYIYGKVRQNNLEREESIITFDIGIKIKKWSLNIHVRYNKMENISVQTDRILCSKKRPIPV